MTTRRCRLAIEDALRSAHDTRDCATLRRTFCARVAPRIDVRFARRERVDAREKRSSKRARVVVAPIDFRSIETSRDERYRAQRAAPVMVMIDLVRDSSQRFSEQSCFVSSECDGKRRRSQTPCFPGFRSSRRKYELDRAAVVSQRTARCRARLSCAGAARTSGRERAA